MFIGVERSTIFRGPLLYLLGGWVPACAISGVAAAVRRYGYMDPIGIIVLTGLNAAMFASGVTVLAVVRSRRGQGAQTPGCVPVLIGVLISMIVSAVPLLVGVAAYEACVPGGNASKAVFAAAFVLPFSVLIGGISAIPGCYVGVFVADAVRRPASEHRVSPTWALGVLAASSVLGLLLLNEAVSVRRGMVLLFALTPVFLFLIGNIWACVGGLGILGYRAKPGLQRWLPLVGAALSGTIAVAAMLGFGVVPTL